eukprot:g6756.t1
MALFSRTLGWSAFATSALLWQLRGRQQNRLDTKRNKAANNGEPVSTPDTTGAQIKIIQNSQGIELYTRIWSSKTKTNSKGVVLCLHTYSCHSQYFTEFAKLLRNQQFNVVAFDMQSHGLSGSVAGRPGDVHKFQDLVNDVDRVLQFVKHDFPDLPIFILGEGFGATIALVYCLRNDHDLTGAVLCSPMVMTANDGHPPFHIKPYLSALEKIMPDLRVTTSGSSKTVSDDLSDPDMVVTKPTLKFFIQSHKCLTELECSLPKIKIPFITVHGGLDIQVPPFHSKSLYKKASSKDKGLKVYDNMHSRLFQEVPESKDRCFKCIIKWLMEHTTPDIETKVPVQESSKSTKKQSLKNIKTKEQKMIERLNINGF